MVESTLNSPSTKKKKKSNDHLSPINYPHIVPFQTGIRAHDGKRLEETDLRLCIISRQTSAYIG